MENPIIVPFDLNTARKIKSGEIEGSVLINDIEIEFLAKFIPYNMIKDFGMEPNEEYNNEERWNSTVVEFTRENVLKQLEEDVRFGFEKALNQRGISASLMFECVMMWNYILEEGLEDWDEDDYGFYGLPLFKATAVKYGWDNPIGEDSGRERKYDSQY